MSHSRSGTFALLSILTISILLLATACIVDENDPPAGLGSGTPEADVEESTQIPGRDDSNNATSQAVEEEEAANETPGEEGLPPPNPEGTQLPLADRTATPGADEVGPQGEIIFPDIRTSGPDFENFTLTITGETPPDTEDAEGQTPVDLLFEQSGADTFHLVFSGADEFDIETWQVDDQMWIRNDQGAIEEASQDLADSFDIAVYLSMLPDIQGITDADEVGQEEIEGHTVTHYTVPADVAVQHLPGMQGTEAQDPDGSIEIWLDEEDTGNILRMTVDLTWTNPDENEQSTQLEYDVSTIDETEEITVPSE